MLALNALADPTRQRIVEMLAGRELSAGTIADKFDVSAPAISQHLKVLRDARLVRMRVDAQRRMYQLDPAGFQEMDEWLTRVRRSGAASSMHSSVFSRKTTATQEGKSHE